jgi:hypothetical protein
VKECRTEAFILQKLNYVHFNPCMERWRLVEKPGEYEHSSAAFYQFGRQGKIEIKDYQDFLALLQEMEEDNETPNTMSPPATAQKPCGETHRERNLE